MVEIFKKEKLLVEEAVEDAQNIEQEMRPYLGISTLAKPCARELWYSFRFCKKRTIKPKQQRLFNRGHQEEPIIVFDLERAGMTVKHCLENQLEFITGHGHIKGHSDGEVHNVPDAPKTVHLGEFKTANKKNFQELLKLGLKRKYPVHYGQMQCYMKLGKYKRGLYIVTCKDNDERYYERVYPDRELAKDLIQKGIDIISTETPPQKIGSASYWLCKYCDYYDICQYDESILKTCRTCQHCDVCESGIWECSKYGLKLHHEQQLTPCDKYKLLESLS